MPMSDGERNEVLTYIRQAEVKLQASKGKADVAVVETLRHMLYVLKRLAGDQAPLVD